MKKLLSLSIFVFLLALVLSAPSVYAKDGNSGRGSFNFGVSNDDSDHKGREGDDSDDDSSSETDDSSDDNSNSSSVNSALEIEADIFTNETIVKVEINDKKSFFSTIANTREDIIKEIILKYPTLTSEEVEAVLNLETEDRNSRSKNSEHPFSEKVKGFFFKKDDKGDSDEKREEFRKKFSAQDVFNRFDGGIKHVEKFILRIETAMNKFQAEGKDITLVKSNLDNAKTDLAQAKDFWNKAKAEWEANNEVSRDILKGYLDSTKQELKSSFENLKKALVALKDLRDNSSDDNSGTN